MLKSAIKIAIQIIPIPLERKLINITPYANLSAVHIRRGNFKHGHDYCICTGYKSLLVFTRILVITQHRTSSCTEMQGTQHDSGVPSDRSHFWFSKIPYKRRGLSPFRMRNRLSTEFEKSDITAFVWLWRRLGLISRPGSWSLYMSIIIYYAQEQGDTVSPPTIYFIVIKE